MILKYIITVIIMIIIIIIIIIIIKSDPWNIFFKFLLL